MKSRLHSTLLVAATFAAALATARADDNTNTIKFSDPAKPGTVKISLGRGDLTIQGADTNEVTIKSESKAVTNTRRKDGMRIISASSSYALGEKDNVVTLDAAAGDWGKGSGNFKLTVPRNTTVVVSNAWGGDFKASNLSGDIEVNSMHGEIRLDDVSGGMVVGTMNGEIRANIRELREGKPLSFTSMNGEITLRLPETAKANVRVRTQNGVVATDFDENVLVTKTEAAPLSSVRAFSLRGSNRGLNTDIQNAIREATKASADAVRVALEAVKEGLEASKLDADEARKQLEEAKKQLSQIDSERRDEERKARDMERRSRNDNRNDPAPAAPAKPATATATTAPKPPMPPVPSVKFAVPTISGGKLVTGTLNGGGPEISISTMNGDVTISKLEKK